MSQLVQRVLVSFISWGPQWRLSPYRRLCSPRGPDRVHLPGAKVGVLWRNGIVAYLTVAITIIA